MSQRQTQTRRDETRTHCCGHVSCSSYHAVDSGDMSLRPEATCYGRRRAMRSAYEGGRAAISIDSHEQQQDSAQAQNI